MARLDSVMRGGVGEGQGDRVTPGKEGVGATLVLGAGDAAVRDVP